MPIFSRSPITGSLSTPHYASSINVSGHLVKLGKCDTHSHPPLVPFQKYPNYHQFLVIVLNPTVGSCKCRNQSHWVRTQSLNILPLKPGVGQYIAMLATLTARDFFLANSYPLRSIHRHFFQTCPKFFLCQLWLTPVPVQARRIKQITLLNAGFRVECLWNINRLQNMCYCFSGFAF